MSTPSPCPIPESALSPDRTFRELSLPILYFGTPVALVSTCNRDGSTNLTALSSLWALGQRIVLGINPGSQGAENLRQRKQCVINLPTPSLWRAVEAIGRTTGRDPVPAEKREMGYRFEPDKFRAGGLTPLASVTVAPLRVAECPLQVEARVVSIHESAPVPVDPAARFLIVEALATKVHAQADIVVPGAQRIDTDAWNPLFYVFRHYFGKGARQGVNFRAEGAAPRP